MKCVQRMVSAVLAVLLGSGTMVGAEAAGKVDKPHIDAALSAFIESKALVGVSALVYEDGQEAYFGAFGQADREAGKPMTRDTLVQIFSMTKPVAGVALMSLYEAGKFQLDDPLSRYAPEFADVRVYAGIDTHGEVIYQPVSRPITIRDITRHTAGYPKNKITAVLFTQYRPFGKVPLHKAFRDAVYSQIPDALAPR